MLKKYVLVSFLFFASQNSYPSQAQVMTRENQNSFTASLKRGISFAWKHPWLCWLSCWSAFEGALSRPTTARSSSPLAIQLFDPRLPICTCETAFVFYGHGLYLWAEIPSECKTKEHYKNFKKKQCVQRDEAVEKTLANSQYRKELQETLEAIRKHDAQQGLRSSSSMQEHVQIARVRKPRQKKMEQQAQRLGITALHLLKRVS